MGAVILSKIPDPDASAPVAAYDLALIRVYNDIVYRRTVAVAALDSAGARLPYLDAAVFRTRHHPFPLAVERDSRHVSRVAFEGKQGVRIRRLDIVELNRMVTGRCQEPLVRRDA